MTQLAKHASQRFGIAVRTVGGRSGDAIAFGFDPDAGVELFHAISTRDEANLRCAEASEHGRRAL